MPLPLVQKVTQCVTWTVAAATRHGLEASAGQLQAVLDAPAGDAVTVVVAGDAGSGKSRLVNALVGRPGLCPVTTTSRGHARVLLRRGDHERATAVPSDGSAPVVLGPGEVARAATTDLPDRPDWIDVQLATSGLEGLVLVDSPGLDGLSGAHGDLALAMLDRADAALVVHDVKAPLRGGEVDFLLRVVARAAQTALVLTRSDASPGHQSVVTEVRQVLEQEPRLRHVEVFLTSGVLAERAQVERERGGSRAELLARLGGVDDLAGFLRSRVAGRGERLRLANLATSCADVITRCADVVDRGGGRHASRVEALRAEDARLAALVGAEPATRIAVQQAVQRMKVVPRALVEDGVRTVRHDVRALVEDAEPAVLERLADDLRSRLTAVLVEALSRQDDLAREVGHELAVGYDESEEPLRTDALVGRELPGRDPLSTLGGPSALAPDAQRATNNLTMARTVMMVLPSIMNPATMLAGVTMAGGLTGAMLWGQSRSKDGQLRLHLSRWADTTVQEAQRALTTVVDSRGLTLQHALETRVGELSRELRNRRAALAPELAHAGTSGDDSERRSRSEDLHRRAVLARALATELTTEPTTTQPATTDEPAAAPRGTPGAR